MQPQTDRAMRRFFQSKSSQLLYNFKPYRLQSALEWKTLIRGRYDTIRYDTRCYFNAHSKADMSQINLPHGNN